MNNYQIFTDSSADIAPEMLREWGVPYVNLLFTIDNDPKYLTNDEMSATEVYAKMRAGSMVKTSGASPESFKDAFIPYLEKGEDILYLAFSSGLSMTYQASVIAIDELKEMYPDRTIITLDGLCASAGFGLLVYLALQKKKSGATIEETSEYVQECVPHLCHWFTVDSLKWLKAGGRVSPAAAFVAGVLDIRPVLHVDFDGTLQNVMKVRGRKASIKALADKLGEHMLCLKEEKDPSIPACFYDNKEIFISHGDCEEDAKLLAEMIESRFGLKTNLITYVGPVIGGHSGPGTLALFFLGDER